MGAPATHDGTALTGFAGTKQLYPFGAGTFGIVRLHVDMAAVKAALAETINGGNSDVLQVWDIPALTHILSCAVYLYKPEGAAATITLGIDGDAAGFLASFDINGVVGTHKMTLVSDIDGLTFGRTFNATDTLDVTFGTDTDIAVAVFDIALFCVFYEFPDLATTAPSTWH